MPDDVAAYALLGLGLLAVAVVLSLPVLALWWLIGTPRPVPGAPPALATAARTSTASSRAGTDEAPGTTVLPGERALRRCEDCGVLWKGAPGTDARVTTLRLRRWVRRRTREKKSDTPAWAKRRGWDRCPSCLSTNVRTSRAQGTRG